MIVPRWFAGIVVCECGAPMEAILVERMEDDAAGHWFFWRCEGDSNHMGALVPVPPALLDAYDRVNYA